MGCFDQLVVSGHDHKVCVGDRFGGRQMEGVISSESKILGEFPRPGGEGLRDLDVVELSIQ